MIVEHFRNTRITSLLLFAGVGLVFWIRVFFQPGMPDLAFTRNPMPLYRLLFSWMEAYPAISKTMALGISLLMAFLVLQFNEKFSLIERRNYLPSFIYFLLVSSLVPLQRLHPALVASVFMFLGLGKLMETHRGGQMDSHFFDAAFLLSLGSLFYFNAIFLMAVYWAGMVVVRPFRIREWLITLAGLATPYLLALGYALLTGEPFTLPDQILQDLTTHFPIGYLNLSHLLFYALVALMILLASIDMLRAMNQKKIRIRKYFKVLFFFFSFALILMVASPMVTIDILVFLAIPVAILLANYFTYIKNIRFADMLLTAFLLLLVYTRF